MYDAIVVGARIAGAPTAMLLARQGHRVLLVDRATFPSDTLSTHYIHQPGIAALKRWGLLDQVIATGCPPINSFRLDVGPFALEGWGPAVDGQSTCYAPRRYLLDTLLVEAARDAGVEVREGFTLLDLTREGDRVTGIVGRDASGATVTETARLVIGADGAHSRIAELVGAAKYNERPALACYYYSYFKDTDITGGEQYPREGSVAVLFPTNDNLAIVGVGWPNDQFDTVKEDVEGHFYRTLATIAPALAERITPDKRADRWYGACDLTNFFRQPWGPGWALVGDAGYHKDPYTGYGITDGLRDAELLAEAAHIGLSSEAPLSEALACYQQRRDAIAMPIYDLICQLASLQAPPPEMQHLFGALIGNQEAINRFIGVVDGTVTTAEFFAPENIGAIMAAAAMRPAA